MKATQLEAFVAVARERHFTRAAKSLHITQSALSQRIKQLEETLQTTLIVRRPHQPPELTNSGEMLLGYCVAQQRIAADAMQALGAKQHARGDIRIGGFSSVMRALALPALTPLVRETPTLGLSMRIAELHVLPAMLLHGEVDYVLTTEPVRKGHIEHRLVGHETNVLVRGKHRDIPHLYLDHDARDTITIEFVRAQSATLRKALEPVHRLFLDDVYALLDGVRLGLGRAVLPTHLLGKDVVVEEGYKPLVLPVYLNWVATPYQTTTDKAVREALMREAHRVL